MKKLILAIALLVGVQSVNFAQTTSDQKKKTTQTQIKQPQSDTLKLKKDGTPDMRYKANKEAAKKKGPLKKDGTPDMRYKKNKQGS